MSEPKTLSAPLAPGSTIGILGGGQLGRMLSLAAAGVGLKTHIYSDRSDAPAFQVSAKQTYASYRNEAELRKFAQACDVITFEFENVPAETLALLAQIKSAYPNAESLAMFQDRLTEKGFVDRFGDFTADFAEVNDEIGARAAFTQIGGPAVLKTRRFGYDGKGQAMVTTGDEAAEAIERFQGKSCILERYIDFSFETSLVAARGIDGEFAAYDPPLNEHAEHILRRSIVPSPLSIVQIEEARGIARAIAECLNYVGVFCVELFVTKDGDLLVNEIAPRVHNSGHWTIDACAVSQFEQHIRAIAGWPLASTERHSDAVMENIIGDEARDWQALAARGGSLHFYGKSEIRPGRKMGHMTWLKPKSAGR